MKGKVSRDLSTPEGREFWKLSDRAKEVESWPAWKRAGINEYEPPLVAVDLDDPVYVLRDVLSYAGDNLPTVIRQRAEKLIQKRWGKK